MKTYNCVRPTSLEQNPLQFLVEILIFGLLSHLLIDLENLIWIMKCIHFKWVKLFSSRKKGYERYMTDIIFCFQTVISWKKWDVYERERERWGLHFTCMTKLFLMFSRFCDLLSSPRHSGLYRKKYKGNTWLERWMREASPKRTNVMGL